MNIMCSQFVKNVFFHKYEQLEASDQDNPVVVVVVQTDSVTLLNISTDINRLCLLFLCLCLQGTSVLSPVLHIGSVIILAMMIYKKSAVQLFEKHPCLYILAFGFVSAKITNKLVVSRSCLF